MAQDSEFRVKGTWFVVARDYILETYGADVAAQMEAYFDSDVLDAWRDPVAASWYPEEALRMALMALHQVPCEGDLKRFEATCAACTTRGIDRFFSVVLAMSTPQLVLRGVPTMWKMIRRGPATVRVRGIPEGSEVSYVGFPFFVDVRYRVLTQASLAAIIQRCRGETPHVEIVEWTADSLTARVPHA